MNGGLTPGPKGPAEAREVEIVAKPLIDKIAETENAIHLTSKTTEFLDSLPERLPQQRRELLEAVAREDWELFAARLEQYAPDLDAAPLFNKVLDQYLTQLGIIKDNGWNNSIRNNDEKRAMAYAEASNEVVQKRHGLGVTDRTLHELEIESFNRIGTGLNDTQRRDMLRAALEVGFSAASVFRMEGEWKLSGEAARKRSRTPSSDEINLQMAATEIMRDKLDELRDALEEIRVKGEDEERRKKAMEAEKSLGYLVGNRRAGEARKMLSKQGAESEELIAKALEEQLALSRELHSGRLGRVAVLPRIEGPR